MGTKPMTKIFQEEDGRIAALLNATEDMYRDAGVELARAVKAAKSGAPCDAKTALQAVRDLKAAFQLAMEEGTKIEKLRKETSAAIGEDILDLDAARDEIGRRLARLRGAGGGE